MYSIYIGELLVGFVIIVLGAKFFTNGIEWLGRKLNLTRGAVGSILAAVGTALPESIIPVVAIFLGAGAVGHEVGIGAILGAPFMLGTLALVMTGVAAVSCRERAYRHQLQVGGAVRRDLFFFLILYPVAVGAAYLPPLGRHVAAAYLVITYVYFVYRTFTRGKRFEEDEDLEPLLLARNSEEPSIWPIAGQIALSLAAIVVGAKVFVDGVTDVALSLGVPAFIFSLLIAPVATELPEKLNSFIWVRNQKDTLAVGNITGAMVFQGSLIPAFGMTATSWRLTEAAFLSAGLAFASAAILYAFVRVKGNLPAWLLLSMGGGFYLLFIAGVLAGIR
ncbi:MAG: sodium:calcium antiporter [Desulfotomaculales bacterium]